MAAVAYIGNHASIFVISIIDDRGMVYNQSEEIEGEKVILWLTNVGGKTGKSGQQTPGTSAETSGSVSGPNQK